MLKRQSRARDGGQAGVGLPSLQGRSGGALYEPNASLMKAGCFHELCEQFGLVPVGPNSHLFVQNSGVTEPPCMSADKDFPGRVFQISAISSMNKRSLRQNLQGITQANISTRNFPLKPEELRRRLKLRDGGDTYLFGTTLSDGSHVILICKKWETSWESIFCFLATILVACDEFLSIHLACGIFSNSIILDVKIF